MFSLLCQTASFRFTDIYQPSIISLLFSSFVILFVVVGLSSIMHPVVRLSFIRRQFIVRLSIFFINHLLSFNQPMCTLLLLYIIVIHTIFFNNLFFKRFIKIYCHPLYILSQFLCYSFLSSILHHLQLIFFVLLFLRKL